MSLPFEHNAVSDGVSLALRVQPRARREGVIGIQAGALKVAVRAAPDKGKANAAVCRLLARALGVARRQVRIIAGQTSRSKRVQIDACSVQELEERLRPLLRAAGSES